MTRRWMLPEGVEELLPPDSWRLEALRRRLLDAYRQAGYQLVAPPLIEHLDALLTASGSDLEAQTFKLTDPATGLLLGLRADMTPQAARIAARHFRQQEVVRLCYLGSVLRAVADGPGGPRAPMQVGCEIFGRADIDADLEALGMMLRTLTVAGVQPVHVGLGHAGIYRRLVARMNLAAVDEAQLFDILQRKSHPDLNDFSAGRGLDSAELATLMDLNGDVSVVATARRRLPAEPAIATALDQVERAAIELKRQYPNVGAQIDLAELRGYRYQSGLVFAAFVPGHGREVARGGRYDGAGAEFGRAMPATGFSADMNELLRRGEWRDEGPAQVDP